MILETLYSSKVSLRLKWTYFWVFMTVFSLAAIAPFLSEHQLYVLTELIILALYAAALNIIVGYGGMISLGHAAFYSIGTYATAIMITQLEWSPIVAVFLAPICTLIGAAVIGVLAVRMTTVYFSMITFAFAQIVHTIILRWFSLTNGDQGIQFSPSGWLLGTKLHFFYFVLAVVSVSLYILYRVVKSPFGLILKATRENRKRVPMIGLSVHKIQLIAFMFSTFFSGLAGAVFALHMNSADPSAAAFGVSIDPLLSTLMGGSHYFIGPLIGTFLYKMLESVFLLHWPGIWWLIMGSVLVLITIYWPRGVMGMLEDPRWEKWGWRTLTYIIGYIHGLTWFLKRKRGHE